jgi:hypothetical protein
MLIMASGGGASQSGKGMLRRRSGAAVTAGVGSTTGFLRFTAALCSRCCFAISAALRVGFLADRATRFFALARVGFIFWGFFIHG